MTLHLPPWRAWAALLALAGLAAACGGVDSGGTGQTVQATTSVGRVSGFGSVIVNGVRFDDSSASVSDDDGTPRSRADLRLGMVVQVQGDLRGNSGTGVASHIQFGPEIAGPVEQVDTANSRLRVLGQAVQVDADTLYAGYPNGLADIQASQLVQVHGFYDSSTGAYTATRLERQDTLAAYALRGRISALAEGSKTFSLGGASIDYGSVAPNNLPRLANGLAVRVSLATAMVSGRWVALSVHSSQRNLPDTEEAELEGYVGAYASPASFQVGGVPVDASGPGVSVRHGVLADLANGVRVEVEGQMRAGVLVASQLDFKRGGQQEFELHGAIESVNAAGRTLVLRGVTVTWDDDTSFSSGTPAALVVGAPLEVKGTPAGGVLILAKSIKFER